MAACRIDNSDTVAHTYSWQIKRGATIIDSGTTSSVPLGTPFSFYRNITDNTNPNGQYFEWDWKQNEAYSVANSSTIAATNAIFQVRAEPDISTLAYS
jgi:hypothetical protein